MVFKYDDVHGDDDDEDGDDDVHGGDEEDSL